jgi:hypothetical protein
MGGEGESVRGEGTRVMVDHRRKRRAPPKRTLIAPLVMLAGGAVAGAVLWRFLMLEPPPGASALVGPEQLSNHDRLTLERLIEGRHTRQ